MLLHPIQKEVGRVAGHGQHRAARLLQQPGVGQQPLKHRLLLLRRAQNGRRAVGHLAVRQDEGVHVLLVSVGVGAVNDQLIKGVGGLGPHAPQHPETVVHRNLHVIPPAPCCTGRNA